MSSKAKTAIVNAFLDLIKTEEYDKITVTALVEKCNISRQTFYYHFNDIDEMLRYAFESETKDICDRQIVGKWVESAEMYIAFLNKYDLLVRKAAKTADFIRIYNMLYNSFYSYVFTYIEKKKGKNAVANSDNRFLISAAASAVCGMVIGEIQKEKSNYKEVLNHITRGFKAIPKA